MLLLSKDGAFLLTYPRRVSELVMSNAARADVLVRCYSPGTSHVFSEGAAGGYAFSGPLFTMDVKSNGGEAPLVFVIEGYQQKDFFLPYYLILFYLMISLYHTALAQIGQRRRHTVLAQVGYYRLLHRTNRRRKNRPSLRSAAPERRVGAIIAPRSGASLRSGDILASRVGVA